MLIRKSNSHQSRRLINGVIFGHLSINPLCLNHENRFFFEVKFLFSHEKELNFSFALLQTLIVLPFFASYCKFILYLCIAY